jgi:hypothetical protein
MKDPNQQEPCLDQSQPDQSKSPCQEPKKLELFPETYEKVFSDQKRVERRCRWDDITVYQNIPDSLDNYIFRIKETFRNYETEFFNTIVRLNWLFRRFQYKGTRRVKRSRNHVVLDQAFGIFIRYYCGTENRMITWGNPIYSAVSTYLDDFFPNFDLGNPFHEPYTYPFNHVPLEFLFTVYQMDERIQLLQYAEEKKLSYCDFLDFLTNWILNYNEKYGEKYIFLFTREVMPYIKNKNRKKYG